MSTCAFHVYDQNTSRRTVNGLLRRLFNDTVYMEFRVCFTVAKYENNIFSLCETSNAFIDAFYYSKIHFHQSRTFELIKKMVKSLHVLSGLSPVWNRYPKGRHTKEATKLTIIVCDEINDRISKE